MTCRIGKPSSGGRGSWADGQGVEVSGVEVTRENLAKPPSLETSTPGTSTSLLSFLSRQNRIHLPALPRVGLGGHPVFEPLAPDLVAADAAHDHGELFGVAREGRVPEARPEALGLGQRQLGGAGTQG